MALTRRTSRAPTFSREEGVREAYAAHGGELYRFALRGLGDVGLAQDAVQETFLRAWRARERYDPQVAALRTWLFGIARNVVVDLHRARGARPWLRSLADHETLAESPEVGPDAWEALVHRWLVEEALRRLGQDHRVALEQTYLLDRSYDEVAAELGIPASTLRSRVFYGLKALRVVMEEMEVSP
ncbi:sigma-70 family RNA polymerase sigma factor [Nocardioides aurantiacus]|uniref:RNA polymerase sigma-70 factor (ECF subfamily) n=1 Tax=Nocardioides aurantiacus TaxID=86796 RepID=A0A3N2CYG5_9ACTN|nr:sigma-70 family RNA polymerase sigma factor [Nocardioides aurantiacus]ROR92234.1 RNA polymerase sigma-70 factor (ECF subfamily) [Nocardioides aurantiacus]